jgi:hypothetical protein
MFNKTFLFGRCFLPSAQVSHHWRAHLSKADEQLLSLIEHAVFSTQYDDILRATVKNRKDVASMLETAPLSALVAEIDEALTAGPGGGAPDDDVDVSMDQDQDGGGAPTRGADDSLDELPHTIAITLAEATKKGADEEKTLSEACVAQCWRRVDTYVDLIQESSDVVAMTDRLKATEVNKLRLVHQHVDTKFRRFILCVYDLKSAGEASSHPATRVPPLRQNGDHLKQCLRVALDSVDEGAEINDRDMYMIFDGGRTGLKGILLAGFTSKDGTLLPKAVRLLQLTKDEDTYLTRFDKVRGFHHDLTEALYCITSKTLDMPVKKRRIYGGTNRSNVIGPIGFPPFTSAEAHNLAPWKEKKDFYSAAAKIACRTGGAGPEGSVDTERKADTIEPVNFH